MTLLERPKQSNTERLITRGGRLREFPFIVSWLVVVLCKRIAGQPDGWMDRLTSERRPLVGRQSVCLTSPRRL